MWFKNTNAFQSLSMRFIMIFAEKMKLMQSRARPRNWSDPPITLTQDPSHTKCYIRMAWLHCIRWSWSTPLIPAWQGSPCPCGDILFYSWRQGTYYWWTGTGRGTVTDIFKLMSFKMNCFFWFKLHWSYILFTNLDNGSPSSMWLAIIWTDDDLV